MKFKIEKTEYGSFIVVNADTLKHIAKGFGDVESALHAVWVLECKPKGVMFRVDDDLAVYSERVRDDTSNIR